MNEGRKRCGRAGHFPAILLIGPTSAGKTPLGERLERTGLWGRACFHFDFGANLRRVGEGGHPPDFLSPADMAVVQRVLASGALLEDDQFHIARGILLDFLHRRDVGPADFVVLNGLPRHVGQADAVDCVMDIGLVLSLECSAEVVLARIRANTGGDRTGRIDDAQDAVERKLQTFEARTVPLLEHYRASGARMIDVPVAVTTTSADVIKAVEACPPV